MRGTGQANGTGTSDTAYLYFADVPTPGMYAIKLHDGTYGPGEASAGVFQGDDFTLWFSDGASGTLEVTDSPAGGLDVSWVDVQAMQNGGVDTGMTSGLLNCVYP